jgi:hypothetical protein
MVNQLQAIIQHCGHKQHEANAIIGECASVNQVLLQFPSLQLLNGFQPGLPDFSRYNIPKRVKIYQITTKYTKYPRNTPNGRKINLISIKYANIFH